MTRLGFRSFLYAPISFQKELAVMTQRLMTMNQAAETLGVSVDQAYSLARNGILPVVRLGRMIRVDEHTLEQFIASGGRTFEGGWRKEA